MSLLIVSRKTFPTAHMQHTRCRRMNCRDDRFLPIVAIELQGPEDAKPRIFTKDNVRKEVWQVSSIVTTSQFINSTSMHMHHFQRGITFPGGVLPIL